MKTIIAPTDFSFVSYNATLYAAKMAEDLSAELILLHIIEVPFAVAEFPITKGEYDMLSMEKELNNLRRKLLKETNNKIVIHTKNILGSVEHEIKHLCKEKKPLSVVLSTHTKTAVDRFFLGSTTLAASKSLQFPVLAIPDGEKYKSIANIALASDLKDLEHLPAHEVETIIKMYNAKLHVFYAGKNEHVINKNTVSSLAIDHSLIHLDPQFDFVENKNAVAGVMELVHKHNIDLLIIIPKKHGLFYRSATKDFILTASVPVMSIHKDDIVVNA